MSAWPTSDCIRIIKGYRKYYGTIDSVHAFRCQNGSCQPLTDGLDEGAEKFAMDGSPADWPGPRIRRALREDFTVEMRELGDGGRVVDKC